MSTGDTPRPCDLPTAGSLRRLAATDGAAGALVAVVGLVASWAITWAAGRVGPSPGTVAVVRWWGAFAQVRTDAQWPGITVLVGMGVLTASWATAMTLAQRRAWPARRMWLLAACWGSPLAVGPPVLSNDVYSYLGQGLMVLHGHSPYSSGPNVLGQSALLAAIDPRWRDTPSPYGPLATAVESVAARIGGGSELTAVIVLRLVAIGSVVAIGILAASLAAPHRPPTMALALTVANPLLLLQVVGAVHLDGLMCALILGALLASRRGHLLTALVLGCAAAAVKAPALVVVVVIIAMAGADASPGPERRRVVARATGGAAAALGLLCVLVPDGWGWIAALSTPGQADTAWAPADLIGVLVHAGVGWIQAPSLVFSTLGRVGSLAIAGCLAWWLLVTVRRRLIADTTGGLLLTAALFGPVVYGWYLLWGLLCLAPGATPRSRPWIVAATMAGCLITVPGLSHQFAISVAVGAGIAAAGFVAVVYGMPPNPSLARSSSVARSK
ncbi:MAG: polyprenol phosphomannose-dependent alpha 1,6 mannosyltransferase MptB [Mycobacteriales bacterium]